MTAADASWRPGELVRAVRPKMPVFAVAILLVSAVHLQVALDGAALIASWAVAFIVCAIVITNDWLDRDHDVAKDRTLATRAPTAFKRFCLGLWLVSAGLSVAATMASPPSGWWLGAIAGLGFVYSWVRHLPGVSAAMVAGSYAALVPLAGSLGADVDPAAIGGLSVPVFAFVFGRETIADLADRVIDIGYKATLPAMLGPRVGRLAAAALFLVALVSGALVVPWAWALVPLYGWMVVEIMREPIRYRRVYRLADVQTIGFMVLLLVRSTIG